MSPLIPPRTTACLLALLTATAGVASAADRKSIPAMGNRSVAYVASTPEFAFHSDFWLNLHDYLYGIAGGGPDERGGFEAEAVACFEALAEGPSRAWRTAESFYREEMGERHHRRDPLMHQARHALANMASEYDPDPELARLLDLLEGAAPAYRECLWEMHDERNRRRVGELAGLLAQYGPALRGELSRYYREPWPEATVLDVVSYSDYAGANTSSLGHTTMSSTQPSTAGFEGLELVLHEASHLIFGPRRGTIARQLREASDARGVKPPGQLWHALSFYTSGRLVTQVARSAGDQGFEPYAQRKGLFGTAFRGYLAPIERHWQPYLDGKVDLSTAMSDLVAATSAPEEAP